MLSNALHTLIAALFARIFGRLEELLRLWQTGLLPPPPVRQAPTSRVTTPQTNRRRASANVRKIAQRHVDDLAGRIAAIQALQRTLEGLKDVDPAVVKKVMSTNAAKLYNIPI